MGLLTTSSITIDFIIYDLPQLVNQISSSYRQMIHRIDLMIYDLPMIQLMILCIQMLAITIIHGHQQLFQETQMSIILPLHH